MTRDEFEKLAVSSGYASKKFVREYKVGKDTFTEDDFVKVYRAYEQSRNYNNHDNELGYVNGVRTTKKYKYGEKYGAI